MALPVRSHTGCDKPFKLRPDSADILDDFVKRPTSALRCIALSLRRTISTPRDTRLARLEFGTFYKVVCNLNFYEPSILKD